MKSGKFNLIFFVLILLLAVLTVVFSRNQKQESGGQSSTVHPHQSYWTCSMHRQVQEDAPGRCRICQMRLVKVE